MRSSYKPTASDPSSRKDSYILCKIYQLPVTTCNSVLRGITLLCHACMKVGMCGTVRKVVKTCEQWNER